ncbi:nipped-B-like protein [Turdus rufiventris]|nr:nipped-B-like protein [Turdus rufiventris]
MLWGKLSRLSTWLMVAQLVEEREKGLYFAKSQEAAALSAIQEAEWTAAGNLGAAVLNQLPLPSPLPATTTKSLIFNGRIAEEVNCLLACRDENLVSQLIHSLNQVSTDHIELKDNLGSDDPEGDIPVLLQAVLARNPNVFREKSMQNRYGVQSGMMMSQFNISQNSMRGSPASSNYQQTTISHSPSSRFVPPQTSSGNRFLAQQNSPVPSPYAPQSPAGYMPYSHPPSYTTHPQMQQASVSSPIVTVGMRNLHENKVSSQLSGNSANHHADNSRHGSNEDYLQMVHRISSDVQDPTLALVEPPLSSPAYQGTPEWQHGLQVYQPLPPVLYHQQMQLNCIYTNAHSMGSKQEELEAMVQQGNYDIVAIMETWRDDLYD